MYMHASQVLRSIQYDRQGWLHTRPVLSETETGYEVSSRLRLARDGFLSFFASSLFWCLFWLFVCAIQTSKTNKTNKTMEGLSAQAS